MAYRISANGKYGILLYWFERGNGEVIIINETYFAIFGKLNFIHNILVGQNVKQDKFGCVEMFTSSLLKMECVYL